MKKIMTNLLNLPEVIVEEVWQEGNLLILSVSRQGKSAICPHCGQRSEKLHQNQRYLVKDLPIGEREVILEEVSSMVEDVAKNVIPIDVKSLKKLGIDEISLVKGQGKFIVVLVDIDKGKLIGLVSERKQIEIEEERKKVFESLKGNKYTLLKAESKLTEKQKEKFEQSKDLITGTFELIDWLKKAKPYYQNSVKTITRWFGEIVGYFEKKTTSGVVEGINNKLKLIKRSGFGFRNFHNFEMRALLSWHYPIDLAL